MVLLCGGCTKFSLAETRTYMCVHDCRSLVMCIIILLCLGFSRPNWSFFRSAGQQKSNTFCRDWNKICPGSLSVVPYTISASEYCISSFTAVRSRRRINARCSSHFEWSVNVLRVGFNVRWNISTKPFSYGWYVVVLILQYPKIFINC